MSQWYIGGNVVVDLDAFCAFGIRANYYDGECYFEVSGIHRAAGKVLVIGHAGSEEDAQVILDGIKARLESS